MTTAPRPLRVSTSSRIPARAYRDTGDMGLAAAIDTAQALIQAIDRHGSALMVMACAGSQIPLVDRLVEQDIPWDRVILGHMDDYVGIGALHPASFRCFLNQRVLARLRVQPKQVIYVETNDPQSLNSLNTGMLLERPIDVLTNGIGENGHIAFINPPYDGGDEGLVFKEVEVDPISRFQQVREGWFPAIGAVPENAWSMTVWAMARSGRTICSVPYWQKYNPLTAACLGPVCRASTASQMQLWNDVTIYTDAEAGAAL